MEKTYQKAPQTAPDEGINELGVASVETKGGGGTKIEPLGFVEMLGISDE